jgi:hypothetical protein
MNILIHLIQSRMLTNNQIIELEYPNLIKISSRICSSALHKDDFNQEMLLIILTMNNEKLNDIYNKEHLNFFYARICTNQWHTTTSPFYNKYIKASKLIDDSFQLEPSPFILNN